MKFSRVVLLLFFVISLTGTLSAQSDQKEAIKKVIQHFFKGLQSGDTVIAKQALADKPILQTAFKNREGRSILRNDDFNRF